MLYSPTLGLEEKVERRTDIEIIDPMSPEDRDGGDSTMPPNNENINGSQASGSALRSARSFLSIPAPIKRIFDRFPLTTYPPNELPHSPIRSPESHELYIFTDLRGSRHGKPSFNPQCLKWQVRLAFLGAPNYQGLLP